MNKIYTILLRVEMTTPPAESAALMLMLMTMVLVTAVQSHQSNVETPLIQVNGSRFIEATTGRSVLFHGVNAVFKTPPYLPQLDGFDPRFSLSPVDARNLREWGFNAVRLGASKLPGTHDHTRSPSRLPILLCSDLRRSASLCSGVMMVAVLPNRNAVNHTYLAQVKRQIEVLAAEGIYTLVDMHQDLLSERLCGEVCSYLLCASHCSFALPLARLSVAFY